MCQHLLPLEHLIVGPAFLSHSRVIVSYVAVPSAYSQNKMVNLS
jgi:hypothetical protein